MSHRYIRIAECFLNKVFSERSMGVIQIRYLTSSTSWKEAGGKIVLIKLLILQTFNTLPLSQILGFSIFYPEIPPLNSIKS